MTFFTAGVGGLCMVIAWAKVMMVPQIEISRKYSLALYMLTVSVCVGTVGSAFAFAFFGETRDILWNLALVVSFACIAVSTFNARKASGPGTLALQIGSVTVFLIDLVCLIGIVSALPGMPLNNGPS